MLVVPCKFMGLYNLMLHLFCVVRKYSYIEPSSRKKPQEVTSHVLKINWIVGDKVYSYVLGVKTCYASLKMHAWKLVIIT